MNYKKAGFVEFETKFIHQAPDPDPNPKLNSTCLLEITIEKATFLKDADLIGKQDPYIQFMYNNKKVRTETKDGAGKQAEWNEKFCLTNIDQFVNAGKKLVLEGFDADIDADD